MIHYRKKKGGRRPRTSRPSKAMNPHMDHATCTEVVEYDNIIPNAPYDTKFSIQSVRDGATDQTTRFQRATVLASQYKLYRCTKVEYEYLPLFNTYQEGSGASVPYLYYSMNRNGEQFPTTGVTRATLERQGATPQKLSKKFTLAYKPNTLAGTASNHRLVLGTANPTGGVISWTFTPKYDEWFTTEILQTTPAVNNPGGPTITQAGFAPPEYYGHWFVVQQDGAEAVPICDVIVKVHWEFKEPRIPSDYIEGKLADLAQLFPTTS